MRLETFSDSGALPPDAAGLFTANPGLFNSRAWWRAVQAFGMPAGTVPLFLLCRLDGVPAALLPLRREPDGGLSGLTTPYTCLYQPLLASNLTEAQQRLAFAAFARFCRRGAATRFDALDADWPGLGAWTARARAAGLAPVRFNCFGNWHESVAGCDWPAYLATRPGALRETIRRRLRRVAREAGVRFDIVRDAAAVEAGIAAYEQVYARSWKVPEPFPAFSAGLIRAGAREGWLRLGLFHLGEQPVAAQLWVVDNGVATVLKLAHDEACKALSPGTVLTAWMLRHLLDEEHVAEIDFGRGDDAYKQDWARERRQRIGLVLANPLRPAGLALALRHHLGRLRDRLRGARREDV